MYIIQSIEYTCGVVVNTTETIIQSSFTFICSFFSIRFHWKLIWIVCTIGTTSITLTLLECNSHCHSKYFHICLAVFLEFLKENIVFKRKKILFSQPKSNCLFVAIINYASFMLAVKLMELFNFNTCNLIYLGFCIVLSLPR